MATIKHVTNVMLQDAQALQEYLAIYSHSVRQENATMLGSLFESVDYNHRPVRTQR